MRKLVLGLLALLLFSAMTAFAVECNDLDEQPDIEDTLDTAAKVEYGITPETDKCVHGKDSYSQDPGPWVREFFCETVSGCEGGQMIVKRTYEDFECARYGFEKCEGGRCVGGKATPSATKKPASAQPICGDKTVQSERGEQCDPPDDICYLDVDGKSKIGVCTRPDPVTKIGGCACKLYQASGTATPEQPEEKKEEAPPVTPPAEEPEQPPETQPPAPEEKAVEPPPAEREPLPTEKMEEPQGVGVTRAITNTVKRFFSWIGSWFD